VRSQGATIMIKSNFRASKLLKCFPRSWKTLKQKCENLFKNRDRAV